MQIPYHTKFMDGLTRFELTQENIHDIALALMAQSHNDQCAPDYKVHCYNLGREFMDIWSAKPENPFKNL